MHRLSISFGKERYIVRKKSALKSMQSLKKKKRKRRKKVRSQKVKDPNQPLKKVVHSPLDPAGLLILSSLRTSWELQAEPGVQSTPSLSRGYRLSPRL